MRPSYRVQTYHGRQSGAFPMPLKPLSSRSTQLTTAIVVSFTIVSVIDLVLAKGYSDRKEKNARRVLSAMQQTIQIGKIILHLSFITVDHIQLLCCNSRYFNSLTNMNRV